MKPNRRSAVALRHIAFEDLGLLEPILRDADWDVSYYEASTADLENFEIEQADLLVVLGGPIGVHDAGAYPFLARERAILERRLARGLPTLGICLGCQLIAQALGARIFPGPVKEIGWGAVTLTDAGSASCLQPLADVAARVLHWHGDTFDLPDGAVRLASNASYDNQAFAFGDRTLALQFHLEADPARLEEWYVGLLSNLQPPAWRSRVCGWRQPRSKPGCRCRPQRSSADGCGNWARSRVEANCRRANGWVGRIAAGRRACGTAVECGRSILNALFRF